MTVIVFLGSEKKRYDGISAIGVGHTRKDLVLVPEGGALPIEISPDQWTWYEAYRVNLPPDEPMVERPPGYRRFALDD